MISGDGQGTAFEGGEDGLLVDLANVQEMSFEAIPKGVYPAVLDDLKYEISKNSGQPMWNARFTITDGQYTNRKLFTYMSFSEKALPGTKRQIKQFAPELLSAPFNAKKIADEGTLIGKTVRLKLDIEIYKPEGGGEAQKRNRVKDVLAPGGAGDGFAS